MRGPALALPADDKALLRARARALARPRAGTQAAVASLELLEFHLADEHYALEMRHLREVVAFKNLTPLPCTPPFVAGVVNVRGRIMPVIDIKRFFGLPDLGLSDLHRVILVRGHDMELGLLADRVLGMCSVPVESLQASLPTLTGIRADYLKGVTAQRLVVLDLDRMLGDPRIVVNEQV